MTRPSTLGVFNIGLAVLCWSALAFLLWLASHTQSTVVLGCTAILFSLLGHTNFSLLHEAVHGTLHPHRRINDTVGTVCAAWFPTALSIQRVFHLGHHDRNRTPAETFDYYYPGDIRWLKYIQWYGIISGVYWAVVVVGVAAFALLPWLFRGPWLRGASSKALEHTSFVAFAGDMQRIPGLRARIELGFVAVTWTLVGWALELSVQGALACYVAFAIQWSALQYADHAFAPLDVREGAWDLKVPTWLQWTFLNYHLHRVHHGDPSLPWVELPRHVDHDQHRPNFFFHYAKMWLGPRPAPGPPARSKVAEAPR